MKKVKSAEERKKEILDAAEDLFALKGFDGTSTNNILEVVGIARGTLYYHFKSKEDIMDALIERYNKEILRKAKEIARDKDIATIERLFRVIAALSLNSPGANAIIEHIHKPQNALMHQKIQKVMIASIPKILTDIVKEGIKEGLFDTPFPYECIEMIIIYSNTIFDIGIVSLSKEDYMKRLEALIYNAEKLLGAKSGSLLQIAQLIEKGNED